MLLVAIWIVFFMTTMTGTGTCTANYTEYSEIWRTADKPIGTEMNRSIEPRSDTILAQKSDEQLKSAILILCGLNIGPEHLVLSYVARSPVSSWSCASAYGPPPPVDAAARCCCRQLGAPACRDASLSPDAAGQLGPRRGDRSARRRVGASPSL